MESTIYTCCICSKPASENCELVHVSPKAVNTLLKSCDIRKASDVNNVRVHSLCRKVFTDSRRQNTLKRKQASHKEFHTYRLKPIGNNIRASWTKTGKSSKNLTFSDFHDFFYADIFSGFLWNFFSWFTYTIWTHTRSFIPTDWNQSEIIFEQVGQKRENRPKIWLFPIFTIFFTPIYSADFCETFFHGSPTPYEHTQGVSYLQIETNRK